MTLRKQSAHPKWGCCGGYHESLEDDLNCLPEGHDFRSMTDEALRELAAREDEVPSHDLCREELLCLLSRRHRNQEQRPGLAILL